MESLLHYHLTLPVNSEGGLTGTAHSIDGETLDAGYEHIDWFQQTATERTFTCPDGGATTPNSEYARCELRDHREWSHDQYRKDEIIFSVEQLVEDHTVIVHQIHDGLIPWFKLKYIRLAAGGLIQACVKHKNQTTESKYALFTDAVIGEKFVSRIISGKKIGEVGFNKPVFGHQLLRVLVRRENTSGVELETSIPKGQGFFYKSGCYYVNNAGIDNRAIVKHY